MSDQIYAALIAGSVGLLSVAVTVLLGGIAAARVAGQLTRSVKISEFRVKWIEELRTEIASFVGAAHRWIRLYEEFNDLTDQAAKVDFEKKEVRPVQNEAMVILYRIRMRINPLDNSPTKAEDDSFLRALQELLNPGNFPNGESMWMRAADNTVEIARRILKREWDETKNPKTKT